MNNRRILTTLAASLEDRKTKGILKGTELVITGIKPPAEGRSQRYFIEGREGQEFLKMNSNAYLGFPIHPAVIAAEDEAVKKFGAGPGAVRFINGTFEPHRRLEKKLASFHARQEAMLFSSAYSTMIGVVPALISENTAVISDELNHNCIINAIRLSRPKTREIYKHCDMNGLEEQIKRCVGQVSRVCIITDGIFSMRGDYAPLDKICAIVKRYNDSFDEGILTIVDDSHGIGAFGTTGRGVEEYCGADGVDVLIGTLGKAFGVNGGYVVSDSPLIQYLRETATTYIYTNPITPSEAAAACKAVEILDSSEGIRLLERLRSLTRRFQKGLQEMGFEILAGDHPIVPLLLRDTLLTKEIVAFLHKNGILSTGLTYPVVPRGDEEIRFQISAVHTEKDIDEVLDVLRMFKKR